MHQTDSLFDLIKKNFSFIDYKFHEILKASRFVRLKQFTNRFVWFCFLLKVFLELFCSIYIKRFPFRCFVQTFSNLEGEKSGFSWNMLNLDITDFVFVLFIFQKNIKMSSCFFLENLHTSSNLEKKITRFSHSLSLNFFP